MKIYVGMCAYNAGPLIVPAIKSIYEFVDRIVVIDGSGSGPSTDATRALALLEGTKVDVVSGTFKKPGGGWDEQAQRQAYLDKMPREGDCWCLVIDADEAYTKENIMRLIAHVKSASQETLMFSHRWLHFWNDLQHVRVDGFYGQPRDYGIFRLNDNVRQLSYCTVGDDKLGNMAIRGGKTRIIVDDVVGHHYGHVLPLERRRWKVTNYYNAGYYGLKSKWPTLEAFLADWEQDETVLFKGRELQDYDGSHPVPIQPFIGSYLI